MLPSLLPHLVTKSLYTQTYLLVVEVKKMITKAQMKNMNYDQLGNKYDKAYNLYTCQLEILSYDYSQEILNKAEARKNELREILDNLEAEIARRNGE